MNTPDHPNDSDRTPTEGDEVRREDVLAMLRQAYAEQRLTLGEYAERLEAARAAQTHDDLHRASAGLPPALAPEAARRRTVAVMGGTSRRGPWRPTDRTSAVAVMGGCHLDLRDAYVEGAVLTIKATAVMGGVTIVVPEGVEVALTGFAVMGGKSARVRRGRPLPETPRIEVKGRVLMGGVKVLTARRRRHPSLAGADSMAA